MEAKNYMKYENNSRSVFKILIIAALIIPALAGCSQIRGTNTIKINKQEQTHKLSINKYNADWQLIGRLRYVRGTIISLKQSSDGRYTLNIKIEFNYHNQADPVDSSDYPFKTGDAVEFVLKDKPKVNLSNGDRIIIYEGQATKDGKNDFLGADIKYYEKQGKYFDMDGNEINLPPQDYPSSL